jgi:very-short-patch-repair endonuclease
MTSVSVQAWGLTRRQEGVISREQLLALGFTERAIEWRLAKGRLFVLHPGVYAVGRREVSRDGHLIAAVLAAGPGAALSHDTAAEVWEIRGQMKKIEVSVPSSRNPRLPGITVHRRARMQTTSRRGIPITTPAQTLADIASRLDDEQLERTVDEAINRDLVEPDSLRLELDGIPNTRRLRTLLDDQAFVVTDTILEQRMAKIAARAGLPPPVTQAHVNGYRVDFLWPDLGIVVEADSLRFHRTARQQAQDRRRDQAHLAAGLTPLRFTHAQIYREPQYVAAVLAAVAGRAAVAAA